MSKTAEIVKEHLGELIGKWADERWYEGTSGQTSGLELLGLDEEAAAERFGDEVGRLLAETYVTAEIETVQLCCVTFDCPGAWGAVGSLYVEVGPELVGEGEFLAEDGLAEEIDWR